MIRHVIWDWNGTLLDDASACVEAINILLRRRHLPEVTHEQYLDIFDFPVRNYYLRLGFDFAHDDWDRVATEYHAVYAVTAANAPLRDGTADLLVALRDRGITLSILSACELTLLKRMMHERGIFDLFTHVLGLSDLHARSKLDLGHELLSRTDIPRGETLIIGDTLHDVDVARAMDVPCLLMTGGHQSAARLAASGCPVVHDLQGAQAHILAQGDAR